MSTNSGADENEMTTLNITAILNGGGDATAAPSIVEAEEEAEFVYRCGESDATTCAETCFGLEDCLSCECTPVYTDAGGPWGDVMDLIFCLLPIMYLIYATVKPNPTPTTRSLPLAALLMLLVRLMYLNSNPILVMGCVILGVHETLTPLSIMAGAITLFETMEATKCLPYMMREMKALTAGHPIAECMLLFAFAYLVEGASGFGTPVALGAPMLVSTGNPAMESVVIMLCFNTFATVWGAVGTPLWFGFGGLGLSDDDLTDISLRSAICMVVGCFILLPFIMTILVPFKVIRANIIFMFLSIASVMGPVVALANYNYEFPSLLGGLIGCGLTAMLITFKVGLAPMEPFLEDIKQQQEQNRPMDASVQKMVQDLADISERIHQPGNNATTNTAANTDDNLEATETATANVNGNDNGDEEINGKHTIQVGEDGATEAVVDIDSKEEKEAESSSPPPPTLTKAASDPNRLLSAEQQLLSTSNLELQDEDGLGPRKSYSEGYLREVAMRTFPIWGVVVLLILTRIEEIGIKEHLIKQTPYFDIHFGSYGEFRLSASIVFQLRDILTYPGMNWKYELFYIPFVVPFVLVSALAMVLFKKDMTCRPQDIAATVVRRLTNPAIALTGALILVQLMIRYTTEAPAYILGNILADWLKEGFIVISPLLGALGSFFSGSTTVSNLTFGEIQRIAAESIGTNVSSMLALQVVGASAGNGICLNNIIAALAVVGLNVSEGQILIRTCRYVFALTTIATVVMLAIFFRFD